jgi:hypothetical protein
MPKLSALAILLLASIGALAQIVGGYNLTATVVTAGTPVPLTTTNTQVKSFAVQLTTGSATICVGGSNVSTASGIGTCISGTSMNIFFPPAANLSYDMALFYVDASANSTAVTVTYAK